LRSLPGAGGVLLQTESFEPAALAEPYFALEDALGDTG
jgi:hypothetical protein